MRLARTQLTIFLSMIFTAGASAGAQETAANASSPMAACGVPSFGNSVEFPVTPHQPSTGAANVTNIGPSTDFNGDGRLDLVVTNAAFNMVSTLLGTGDGRFGPATTFTVGSPHGVAIADFNRDGRPDLAVASKPNSVAVLLGTGTGSFGPPVGYPAGNARLAPSGVAVGDFNEDGHADLAVATIRGDMWFGPPSTVAILLGTGTGAFGPQSELHTGGIGGVAWVADLDRDGHLDVVAGIMDGVAIFAGTGTGSFGAVRYVTGGRAPADVNGDGWPDLVSWEKVRFGDGTGNFGPVVTVPGGGALVADFDGDGVVDLANLRIHGGPYDYYLGAPGSVSAVHGDGTGGFGSPAVFPVGFVPEPVGGSRPSGVAIGDFDGDGRADLAIVNSALSVTVSVLLAGRCEPGGKALRLSSGPLGVALDWIGGAAQSGYVVARVVDGVTTILPGPATPLGASATTFTDSAPVAGRFNCYAVLPIGAAGVMSRSHTHCVVPNSGVMPGAPPDFFLGVRVNPSTTAILTWKFPNFTDAFFLLAIPLDGGARSQTLAYGYVSTTDETLGVPTCYRLFRLTAIAGGYAVTGQSDVLCTIRGADLDGMSSGP